MKALDSLLAPRSIAVVGASSKGGRGAGVIANLKRAGFQGTLYGIHPADKEVHGVDCYPDLGQLPAPVDCVVVAIPAEAACVVLERAFELGTRAAVVLSSGFGEGGHGLDRVARLKRLAAAGMAICGPNCFGLINARNAAAMFSGPLPALPLKPGPVALVSQSGGLGQGVVTPLMRERSLGFAYFVSCGNQIATSLEDYIEHFVDDPDIRVVAAVVEELKDPGRLAEVARRAHRQGKVILVHRVGRSAAGQRAVASHTGALTSDATVFSAFLRRCGIVEAENYDEFVEAVELFGVLDGAVRVEDVIVVSGSGGGAAAAADALGEHGVPIAEFDEPTIRALGEALPGFGTVGNPIDCTGAVYDDRGLLKRVLGAVDAPGRRSVVAVSVLAFPAGSPVMRNLCHSIVDCKRSLGLPIVAYQASPLGGPLDREIVDALHAEGIPFLMGMTHAMGALKHLISAARLREAALASPSVPSSPAAAPLRADFLSLREALVGYGLDVVAAAGAGSEDEAADLHGLLGPRVAVKIEVPGLLHKSEVGGVVLNCPDADAIRQAYREVTANASAAGFAGARQVIVQSMAGGGIEMFVGALQDVRFGTSITFGLGGIFIEILSDSVTEVAPLTRERALSALARLKGYKLLLGARGQAAGDVDALADFLVKFSEFAVNHAGSFRSLELNPIFVGKKGEGVVAVDIALESGTSAESSS